MNRRDLHSNVKAVSHIVGTVTATQTPAAGVDLSGFGAAEFVIHVGAISNGGGTWAFKFQESDSPGSGFTDVVTAGDVLVGSAQSPAGPPDSGTGVFVTVTDADDDAVYRAGYIGTKRYVRVVATAASAPGNTAISVVAILGNPAIAPTSD